MSDVSRVPWYSLIEQRTCNATAKTLDEVDDPDDDVCSDQMLPRPDLVDGLGDLNSMLYLRKHSFVLELAGDLGLRTGLLVHLLSTSDLDIAAGGSLCHDWHFIGSRDQIGDSEPHGEG